MKVPMYVLAVGSMVAGWFGWVFNSVSWSDWPVTLISPVLAIGGIALAWYYYVRTQIAAGPRPAIQLCRQSSAKQMVYRCNLRGKAR